VVNVTSIVNYYTLISFLDNSTYRTSWDNHFINPTITKMIWAVAPSELILFYVTCIRSILEYACPVFHRALPSYLSDDLERLQKLAMKVIYPLLSYTAALKGELRWKNELFSCERSNNFLEISFSRLEKLCNRLQIFYGKVSLKFN